MLAPWVFFSLDPFSSGRLYPLCSVMQFYITICVPLLELEWKAKCYLGSQSGNGKNKTPTSALLPCFLTLFLSKTLVLQEGGEGGRVSGQFLLIWNHSPSSRGNTAHIHTSSRVSFHCCSHFNAPHLVSVKSCNCLSLGSLINGVLTFAGVVSCVTDLGAKGLFRVFQMTHSDSLLLRQKSAFYYLFIWFS